MDAIINKTEKLIQEYIINYFNELDDDKFDYYKRCNDDDDDDNNELLYELFSKWKDTNNNFFNFIQNNYNDECRYKLNTDFIYILQFVAKEYTNEYGIMMNPEKFTDLEFIVNNFAEFIIMENVYKFCEIFEKYERPTNIILK